MSIPAAIVRAAFAPATYDEQARTVELVWTTGSRVRRIDWVSGREFDEELEVSTRALDLSRLNAGAPLLDTHDQWSLDAVIGVVERAWVEGEEGRAIVRFSGRPSVAGMIEDVRAGIIRNVSVGYTVQEWAEVPGERGAVPVRRAVRWQPHELSLVPVPADAAAQVRGADPRLPAPAPPAAEPATPEETTMSEQPIETRAAETAAQTTADAAERAAPRIGLAEYERVAASSRGIFGAAWAAEQFRAQTPLDAARDAVVDALAARLNQPAAPAPSGIVVGRSGDDPAEIRAAMADALAVRAMPGFKPASERFREFGSLRISDMMIELARANGENVGVRDRNRLIERALHTTSDFPLLLENAGNKLLEAGFAAAAPSYRMFFAQRSFNDFKPHSFLTAGDFPALSELNEGGEITAGTISEKRERITARTYARSVSVTRQMLVNDDLGAFNEFGAMIGRRVADQENAIAYALVNTASGDGPTLTTGNAAVFGTGAARANKASAGAAISEATLDAGHAAIMSQTSIDGIRLNLQPSYLLTGAAYRGAALRFTTRITADAGQNVGLYSNLTPIADANIPGNRWYLFASPAAAPVYVYGYVNGQSAPQIRVWNPMQGRDGLSVEVVHDFAVGAIDHRGGWFNPGA